MVESIVADVRIMTWPPLFLYLNEHWHADAWISGGGPVPINPASSFRSQERRGTSTPDEVVQRAVSGLAPPLAELVKSAFSGGTVIFEGVTLTAPDGSQTVIDRGFHHYQEDDSLIVCLSKTLSKEQARRFSEGGPEKKTVVRIKDPVLLLRDLGEKLGIAGQLDHVRYTYGLDRGRFVKHVSDAWQSEVRLSFPITDGVARTIMLDTGHAELVDLDDCNELVGSSPRHFTRDEMIEMASRPGGARYDLADVIPPPANLPLEAWQSSLRQPQHNRHQRRKERRMSDRRTRRSKL